jgi:hypothetical protein
MSQRCDLALFDGDQRLDMPTADATGVQIITGPRGLEQVRFALPLATAHAFELYRRLGRVHVRATAGGTSVARSRVESLALTDAGATVSAAGAWVCLSDRPTTTFWSASGIPGWFSLARAYQEAVLNNRTPELYAIELSERIAIQLTKGTTYLNAADVGGVAFRVPNASTRLIVGIQFRLRLLVPAGWRFQLTVYGTDTFRGGASAALSILSTGVELDNAYYQVFAPSGAIELCIYNNTGSPSSPAGETGDWYAWISDIRVVGSTARAVATELIADRPPGTGPASVVSTAGMYVGQQLVMKPDSLVAEIVTVQAINGNTFTATFTNLYLDEDVVAGHQVEADEIVRDLLAATTIINGDGPLQKNAALIARCPRDVLNASWEDTPPADIIAELAARGDGTRRFATGTTADGWLFFRPEEDAAQHWYIDIAELDIQQSIEGLCNRVVARAQDASGRTIRTTSVTDLISLLRYGLTRAGTVDASTTNLSDALRVAETALAQTADPLPQASIRVEAVYTANGSSAPLHLVRAGDLVTIRNLPPEAAVLLDRLATFRLAETTLDYDDGVLQMIPESPLPDYAHQQAAIQQAADIAATLTGTAAAAPITVLAPQQLRRRNPPRRS